MPPESTSLNKVRVPRLFHGLRLDHAPWLYPRVAPPKIPPWWDWWGEAFLYSMVPTTPTVLLVDADGTYIASDGWHSATVNTVRAGGPTVATPYRGGLYESTRTNLLTYSAELTGANDWDALDANLVATVNAAVAPDGTTTADKLAIDAANSYLYQASTLTDNLAYAFSVFAKAGTSDEIALVVSDETAVADRLDVTFSVTAGVIAVDTETVGSGYVVDHGSGWYRLVGLIPVNTVVGANTHRMRIYPAGTTGTPTSEYAHFWGAQFEAGSFASSYIPTTTAAVQRTIDQVSYDTAAIFGTGAITVYGLITPAWEGADEDNNHYVFDSRAAGNGAYVMHVGSSNILRAATATTVGDACTCNSTVAVERHKAYAFGFAYDTNDSQFRVKDIAAGAIDNSGDLLLSPPASHGPLTLGADVAKALSWDGWIRDLLVYQGRHTQAEMDETLAWLERQSIRAWSV